MTRQTRMVTALLLLAPWVYAAGPDAAAKMSSATAPWWIWPVLLFALSFLIGIVATIGGIGGGVLFVPLVSSLFPFHLDFVRGAALVMALAGSMMAAPRLLRSGMANLRLTLPLSLCGSISSIIGARIGLLIPQQPAQLALGVLIVFIVLVMAISHGRDFPRVDRTDALAAKLRMFGEYMDPASGSIVAWRVHRVPLGLLLFFGIGFVSGMFGLGAGWANVPALNLVMGAPLKVAVASSVVILAVSNTSAAWVYLHQGAVLALIAVPAVLGISLGSPIGAMMLTRFRPAVIRRVVIAMLLLAGARAILRGLGV